MNVLAGFRGEPCENPDKARFSMEALAINVVSLLGKFNLDNKFHDDRITWTGMVLFDKEI
jgi:predicted metal-binding protein